MIRSVLGVSAVLLLASCGNEPYPPEAMMNFMNSCHQSSGGNTKFCSCAIENIQKALSYDEFLKLETRMAMGDQDSSRRLADLVTPCRS